MLGMALQLTFGVFKWMVWEQVSQATGVSHGDDFRFGRLDML
jgi:hypothetical protein